MLFHKADKTLRRMRGCWRRSSGACDGPIDPQHPLAAAWSNLLMWLDAEDAPILKEDTQEARAQWFLAIGSEGAESLRALDWFAEKVEQFSRTNMLSEDKTAQAMLYRWRRLMPFDPTRLPGEQPPPVMPQG